MGVRDTIAKALMGIKAYHSSPHDFDKFDLKKIGTGEGAQVYGHGLYFAENPAVSGQGGQYWNQFTKKFEGPDYLAAGTLKQAGFDRDAAAALAPKDVDALTEALKTGAQPPGLQGGPFDEHTLRSITRNMMSDRQAELDLLRSNRPVGPRTYEVNIKADPAQMLDWDKPLAQQGILDALSGSRRASVQDVLNRIGWQKPTRDVYGTDIGPVTGQDFYKALSYDLTGKPNSAQASKAIAAGGVPGIKYLDEGSRPNAAAIIRLENTIKNYEGPGKSFGDLEGWQRELERAKQVPLTNNYVVFDPANIDILKKYGVAAMPTGALAADQMGSTFDQRYYGAQP